MRNLPYIIRNFRSTDFSDYVSLNREAEILEPSGRRIAPQLIAEHLGQPNYNPEQNLFVVEIASNIIGYLDVTPELITRRAILNCWVHPKHRRRGIATKLLNHAMYRAQKLEATAIYVNIAENNTIAKKVLSKLGFSFVRQFLKLRLDITKFHQTSPYTDSTMYHHLKHGEEDKLTLIQNRAFTDTWGYNPNTVEEIAYHINSSTCSPEDIALIYEKDKIISYCWTGTSYEGETISKRKGRIFMLGVDPDHRGRGMGRKALMAGLTHLKRKNLQIIELTVDSENKAALALYQSAGFKIWASNFWYKRTLNYTAGAK
jgi:mycothiol synthase